MAGNVISCRVGVFPSLEIAFAKFPEAGILHAEVAPPANGDYAGLAQRARAAGVTVATLATGLNLATDDTAAAFRPVIAGAAAIGVPRVFVSAHAPAETPRAAALARLRAAAECAAAAGVTICMETHPPYGANGAQARATLEAVNSRGLRYNFDTANIYYYNQGTDSVSELRKVADLVASVHLKDTDGGYQSGNFPPIGRGVVDFRGVFAVLGAQGFRGPYTLELEGGIIDKLDLDGRVGFLRDCVQYLKDIGAV